MDDTWLHVNNFFIRRSPEVFFNATIVMFLALLIVLSVNLFTEENIRFTNYIG